MSARTSGTSKRIFADAVQAADPLLFRNSLVDEMLAVEESHRFTREDIKRLIVSAIEMSSATK